MNNVEKTFYFKGIMRKKNNVSSFSFPIKARNIIDATRKLQIKLIQITNNEIQKLKLKDSTHKYDYELFINGYSEIGIERINKFGDGQTKTILLLCDIDVISERKYIELNK